MREHRVFQFGRILTSAPAQVKRSGQIGRAIIGLECHYLRKPAAN